LSTLYESQNKAYIAVTLARLIVVF
jgi:hypothetical protein